MSVWIKTVCAQFGASAPVWYERSDAGLQQMVDAITAYGFRWFCDTSTAEGIVDSAAAFTDLWYNEDVTHVELGHCLLRAGRLRETQRVFDRKPKRVARYKTSSKWIAAGDAAQIGALHAEWIAVGRHNLRL